MTAIEFVKKFGIEYAIKILNYDPSISDDVCHLDFGETENLKQIVDAWELVESYGGLVMAKRQYSCFANACESVGVNQSPRVLALGRAISLVEQCQRPKSYAYSGFILSSMKKAF